MKYIIFVFLFFCCFKILCNKGVNKFIWLMIGMLMINSLYSPIIKTNSHLTLASFYLISLFTDNTFKSDLKQYPLKNISIIICFIYFIIALFTEWQPLWKSLYNAFLDYIISFFMLFVGYHAIKTPQEYDKVIKVLIPIVLISSIYGLICFILKDNPYNKIVGISDVGIDYNSFDAIRGYRISGFSNTSNPHAHILTIGSFIILNRKINKISIFIALLSLMNLFLSDSRAPIADLAILCFVYFILSKNLIKNVLHISIIILLLLLIPGITNILIHTISNINDVFSAQGENEISGSSMALRFLQFEKGLEFFTHKPIFGHGFGYYEECIYEKGTDNEGLWGMESYLLWLMVEMGFLMIIASFLFYKILLCSILKYKECKFYKIPLSISIMLITYLLLNRPSDIYEYTLPFIGLCLKMLKLYKYNKNSPQYNTALN